MAYQSEAALEQQFIEQLNKQEYSTVSIPDYDALVANFKVQFEAFNATKLDAPLTEKEWERIFNLMLGKSVFLHTHHNYLRYTPSCVSRAGLSVKFSIWLFQICL